MTRKEAIEAFGPVGTYGTIKRPGKFEGERLYVPALAYEALMDGVADEHADGSWSIAVTAEDRREFPELKRRRRIRCYEWSDGFVCEVWH